VKTNLLFLLQLYGTLCLFTNPAYCFQQDFNQVAGISNDPVLESKLANNQRKNISRQINSPLDEVNPILSNDGKTLFFARKNSPENIGGKNDPQDIWYSVYNENSGWSEGKNLGPEINTKSADNLTAVGDDNSVLYFFVATRNNVGYFTSKKLVNNKWSKSKPLGLEVINESRYLESTMNKEGNVLLFTAKNCNNINYEKDRDERDIYVSTKNANGKWTKPLNLGPSVNTSSDEFSPVLAADGKTLYFASKGRTGYGNSDIYMARRIGSGWTQWSEPVNLGREINSIGFDAYFAVNPSCEKAYFVSHFSTTGKGDIFEIKIPEPLKPQLPTELSSFSFGEWLKYQRNSKNFVPGTIFFEEAKAELTPASFPELSALASFLKAEKNLAIEIHGHTDNQGTSNALLKLSKNRSLAIKKYLVAAGISERRIFLKAHGGNHPKTSNDCEENRRLNRRVEFRIRSS
jgi:outer membrane protein OmpA-like peptidoglycan-associated protein